MQKTILKTNKTTNKRNAIGLRQGKAKQAIRKLIKQSISLYNDLYESQYLYA